MMMGWDGTNGMRVRWRLFACMVALAMASLPGCVLINADLDPLSRTPKPLQEHVVAGAGDAKILVLDVNRVITSESERRAFGLVGEESVVARIEAELQQAEEDEDVKGLLVRINTPGGTVTASDILYQRLMRFRREQGVPIVAQLMDIAASGGYYTALAADEIIAHPTSVTGSVGVIFQGLNFESDGQVGVATRPSERRQEGHWFPTTQDERRGRAMLEQILANARPLRRDHARTPARDNRRAEKIIADGRIVTAGQALEPAWSIASDTRRPAASRPVPASRRARRHLPPVR
jgi:protease-4